MPKQGNDGATRPIAIKVADLHKSFGTHEVLKGVSLTAREGDVVAIIGGSGSGKSTMLRCINFLETPSGGQIEIGGEAVTMRPDGSPSDRRQIERLRQSLGMVFQSFNLIPRTSALENAQLPLFYRGLSIREQRTLAAAALERVGLKGRGQHYPTQLSGGQQQRGAIARALVTTPSLLLADEPTGNLDTESSREIMTILDRLNKEEGITIILVTHEPDIAAYAAREIVIKDGQVLTDRHTKPAQPSSLAGR